MKHLIVCSFFVAALGAACSREASPPQAVQTTTAPAPATPATDSETKKLKTMAARFAPVDLAVDVSALPANERQALAKLVEASRVFDALFLRQVWEGNETMLLNLVRDTTPLGRARFHYFMINKGPWSRLDHNEPFVPGAPPKPAQANVYAAGASKADIEAWMKTLPDAERTRATGFFTAIRRAADGKFVSVPYSLEYQGELAHVSMLLREAASLTTQPTLKAFLEKRAAALLSNDYYESDLAWMALDASIEPTIGPYEVYEDEWFNYKAAFESFITVRDDAETQKLGRFGSELQEIENNLPIDPTYRNKKLGALAPIRVVNVVFSAGDANRGVQTAAYNLPNDERIVQEKGSKRVMLKNTQEAKFKTVLLPIAQVALAGDDRASGVQGNLQHDRRGQGRRLGPLRDAIPDRSREAGKDVREHDVHDLPGVDVPLDPLRDHGGAWPRCRHPDELLPRPRRRHQRVERHLRRQRRALQTERHRAHPGHHDDAGARRLRGGQADDRHARRRSPARAGGARQIEGCACRHRAAFRHGGFTEQVGSPRVNSLAPAICVQCTIMSKRYTVAHVRERLSDALDQAERGEAVIIERHGTRFRLSVASEAPARRRRRKPRIEVLDPAVADGQWSWSWTPKSLSLQSRKRR